MLAGLFMNLYQLLVDCSFVSVIDVKGGVGSQGKKLCFLGFRRLQKEMELPSMTKGEFVGL